MNQMTGKELNELTFITEKDYSHPDPRFSHFKVKYSGFEFNGKPHGIG